MADTALIEQCREWRRHLQGVLYDIKKVATKERCDTRIMFTFQLVNLAMYLLDSFIAEA